MARYCGRTGRKLSDGARRITVEPNPYEPGTPTYAERHRQTSTKVSPTLTRVDLGEPVKLEPHR